MVPPHIGAGHAHRRRRLRADLREAARTERTSDAQPIPACHHRHRARRAQGGTRACAVTSTRSRTSRSAAKGPADFVSRSPTSAPSRRSTTNLVEGAPRLGLRDGGSAARWRATRPSRASSSTRSTAPVELPARHSARRDIDRGRGAAAVGQARGDHGAGLPTAHRRELLGGEAGGGRG